MEAAMTVGNVVFGERTSGYYESAREAGNITMVRPLRIPPAANDNAAQARPRVVGLMGYAGSGKSTVANILRERYGYKGPHIKAPLAGMARSLLEDFGIRPTMILRYLDGDLKREVIPEIGRSGTEIQQFLGSQFGRDFCRPDLWLECWVRSCDAILSAGGRVVQESVRYANEADAVRARGGIIVEVRRPGVGPINNHSSESLPTDPDIVIRNNGTISDLRVAVDEITA